MYLLTTENPDMVFTSIGHLINEEMLRDCHAKMDKDKAVGIDGITKDEYGEILEANLMKLVESLKNKSYRPKPARRVEIPKDNGKTRPLRKRRKKKPHSSRLRGKGVDVAKALFI